MSNGQTKTKRNKRMFKDYKSGKFRITDLLSKYNVSHGRFYEIINRQKELENQS